MLSIFKPYYIINFNKNIAKGNKTYNFSKNKGYLTFFKFQLNIFNYSTPLKLNLIDIHLPEVL